MTSGYWQKSLTRRISRRRALAATAASAAGAVFLAACGGGDSGTSDSAPFDPSGLLAQPVDTLKQARRGGVLTRSILADPPSFDPSANYAPLVPFYETVLGRLVGFKPGILRPATEEIDGDICESWEFSPDRLQITLKLRPNVRWHNIAPVDGRAVDVEDILYSWERFSTLGSQRSGLANVANPDAPVLSVTAPDARTIVIRLKDPIVYALSMFGARENVNIVPKEARDQSVLDPRSKMIGTGPFYLADYQRSQSITLKRHSEFWNRDLPLLDQVNYSIIPEYVAMQSQFRAGNLLVPNPQIRLDEVLPFKKDVPGIRMYNAGVSATGNRLIFGWRTPALRDERVRQALSMAYDRDLWIDIWNNTTAPEAEGLTLDRRWFGAFPSISENYDGWRLEARDFISFGMNARYFEHNLGEVKKLLSAAGYANGLDLKATGPRGTEYGTDFQRQMEVRQGFQNEAGIRFDTNLIDYQTEFIPSYRDANGRFEGIAYRSGPPAASSDPVGQVTSWYYSKAGPSFLGFDAAGRGDGSGDPLVDSLIVKAQQERDAERRKSLLHELERHLAQKMYVIQGLGGASAFSLAWEALENFQAYRGASANTHRVTNSYWWVNSEKAPLRNA